MIRVEDMILKKQIRCCLRKWFDDIYCCLRSKGYQNDVDKSVWGRIYEINNSTVKFTAPVEVKDIPNLCTLPSHITIGTSSNDPLAANYKSMRTTMVFYNEVNKQATATVFLSCRDLTHDNITCENCRYINIIISHIRIILFFHW